MTDHETPGSNRRGPDAEDIVSMVLDRVDAVLDERQEWMQKRDERYRKFRGWIESRDWPWTNASNQHIPALMADSLRMKAGLLNALLGTRPIMDAEPLRREHQDAGTRAAELIEYQVFRESDGETRISAYVDAFVDDGTALTFQTWARDWRTVRDVRVIPRPTLPLAEAMPDIFQDVLFPSAEMRSITRKDEAGRRWTVEAILDRSRTTAKPISVEVTVESDGAEGGPEGPDGMRVILEWDHRIADGPSFLPHALEDIVVPMRSENCQPVSSANPMGAPWIARTVKVNLDTIRRRRKDGTYDLISDEDLDAIEAQAESRVPLAPPDQAQETLRQQKDAQAGLEPQPTREEREWVTLVEWYGPWDLNGDGLDEEAVFSVIREGRVLARRRWLTELYPVFAGEAPWRPFGEARMVPVPGQFYGIGVLELAEGLHDLIHVLINQTIDNGTLANVPSGAYRASSGFKPDEHRIEPGLFLPTDDPQRDIQIFQWPQREQTWGLNMIALARQFLDQLLQIGPIQLGQVPTGKASALRTVGTTLAILQQGAALPEQILRRAFQGLAQIWEQIHRMNARFLPRGKEYLVAGIPRVSEDAYRTVDDPDLLAVPLRFGFKATLLNTNKGLVSQALQSIGVAVASPLMLQLGIVDAERLYQWIRDLIRANTLDPDQYVKRPPGTPAGPRLLAEEAMTLILEGRLPPPDSAPLEPAAEHLQKLLRFSASPEFGLLRGAGLELFQQYVLMVQARVQAEAQSQQVLQAAQTLSQGLRQGGGGDGGGGGVLSTIASPEQQVEAPELSETEGGSR